MRLQRRAAVRRGGAPMIRLVVRRVLVALPTLVLVSMLVFALQKLLPGDPVLTLAGEERDPEVLAYLRDKYRLDDPIPMQYLAWVGQVLQGDFGISLRTGAPVTTLIAQKLPVTIQLAALAMVFAVLIGIPAGILSAVRKGTAIDYAANVVALSGLSIPNFWLGIMLILLVSVEWRLSARLRLRPALRGPLAQPQDHVDAGLRARHGDRRLPDAAHPVRHAQRAAVGLHPHGARQGASAARPSC